MANPRATRLRRCHAVANFRNTLLLLLCVRQSKTELEAHTGEIRDTYRSLARHIGTLPVREGHEGSLGLVLFGKSCWAAVAVQRCGGFFESLQHSGTLFLASQRNKKA